VLVGAGSGIGAIATVSAFVLGDVLFHRARRHGFGAASHPLVVASRSPSVLATATGLLTIGAAAAAERHLLSLRHRSPLASGLAQFLARSPHRSTIPRCGTRGGKDRTRTAADAGGAL